MSFIKQFFATRGGFFTYFIILILLGSGLLLIPGLYRPGLLHPVDAFFTAVSAVCVTGLITVNTADFNLLGQIVILFLIQCGGLGILTFAVVYLGPGRRKLSLRERRFIQEISVESIEYHPRKIIRTVLTVTLGIEAVGALALLPFFIKSGTEYPIFAAVFHGISAFCNAGFSTFPNSLEGFAAAPGVQLIIMFLIILGGLGFAVILDCRLRFFKRKKRLALHSHIVLVTTVILIVTGTLLYWLFESRGAYAELSFGKRILASLFQSITNRTAGFNTIPQGDYSLPTKLFTLPFMFIGGASGSIAGGVKVSTFAVAMAALFSGFEERGGVVIRGRKLPSRTVHKAYIFLAKAFFILFISFFMIILAERNNLAQSVPLIDLLFETVSAFGTVGLSTGITAGFTAAGKLILAATMFAGRVGLFAVALPLATSYQLRHIDFPEEEVMIG
ncbi:MAG: potassium transporter [Spirochaetales bacterium]|nr:potassium transporter [Spirochaetales bacterium]